MTSPNENDGHPGYRGLLAWQQAMDLSQDVYLLTRGWPSSETYGMTSQVRRAVVSVAANVAEGQGRNAPGDFGRFLNIAHGSLCETETLLILSTRIGLTTDAQVAPVLVRCTSVGRLIKGLIRSIRNEEPKRTMTTRGSGSSDDWRQATGD